MSNKNITDSSSEDFDLDRFLAGSDTLPKLTDEQVDALEAFLEKHPRGMDMELLDGFFCGLICGPVAQGPEPYLQFILGGNEPVYESDEQAEAILGAINQHWDHIESAMQNEEQYFPFFYSDSEFKVSANDWSLGFILAVDRYRSSWEDMLMEAQADENLITPILQIFSERLPENAENPIGAEDREYMITTIVENLHQIYHYFAEQREKNLQGTAH